MVDGVVERAGHRFASNAAVGGEMEEVAGVVINPADDFAVKVVGVPVREVRLPQTVGLWCGEELVGRSGPFLGLVDEESRTTAIIFISVRPKLKKVLVQ